MTVLLDISRSLSRVGLGAKTGVDRVETAYINEVLDRFDAPFFLAKLGSKFAILSVETVRKLLEYDVSGDWPNPVGLDRFRLKLSYKQRCARSFLRKHARATVPLRHLGDTLSHHLADDWHYINVGHSNLSDSLFEEFRRGGCSVIDVFIHDLIPLDHPEYTRPDTTANFEHRMRAVSKHANRVICNSHYTERRVQKWFSEFGRTPKTVVSFLGVEVPFGAKPRKRMPPTFVYLGTIEPRKNHMVLLKAWEHLAETVPADQMPILNIIGRRGWENQEVFDWLDTSPLIGKWITEMPAVTDVELWEIMGSSTALLFPSFVEGFGLPVAEAALMGVPVICSDLPVLREILGDYAEYLSPKSVEDWAAMIQRYSLNVEKEGSGAFLSSEVKEKLTWASHFSHVFKI